MKKTGKRAVTILVSVVLWVIILLAALFAFTTLATRDDSSVASFMGYTPMVVETDSMAPTFNSGDLIIIKKCDPETLEVGDIITFHTIIENEYALNTHRIEAIDETNGVRSYTTKGDNNAISDTHIIADGDIVGVYVGHVQKLGKVMDFLSSSVGFLCIIVLPMLLFFIYQVYHLIMVSINLKKATAEEDTMEKARQIVEQERAAQAAQNAEAKPAAPAAEDTEQAATEMSEAEKIMAEAAKIKAEAEAMKAKAEAEAIKAKAEAEAMKAKAEAQAALAEAQRLKAEAEAAMAEAGKKEEAEAVVAEADNKEE